MHHQQDQFLNVIDRDEAESRFHAALTLEPLGTELAALEHALGRVLAEDVLAAVDVPSFDRSNLDGYAVRAEDTFAADEQRPRSLRLLDEVIATAVVPQGAVIPEHAMTIATGGMLPRGADAIVMIEHADVEGDQLLVRRAVTPGFGIAYAGTDIGKGETVVRRGELLTSRETGVLAAIGVAQVPVWRRPQVAILSTGDEIIQPGEPMRPGCVYDSNARILSDAVRELGADPVAMGIIHDDEAALRDQIRLALGQCDLVLLSGGTSKGAGDVSYRVVREFDDPGIVAHGVALKPGKPICLAVTDGRPVVILPGFPTSAIFTFHEFVAPVLRKLGGQPEGTRASRKATMAVRVNSEIGRTEYVLVGLAPRDNGGLAAYPMGKGSGSMTTYSRADGIVTIDRHEEIVEAGASVNVRLIGDGLEPADLIVIGSHCLGLDFLLSRVQERGFRCKFLSVGSSAGLQAAQRGECDLAGIHLLDPETGQYNRPFLDTSLELVQGYLRKQGVVFRTDDERFVGCSTPADAMTAATESDDCRMINRNQGSGTRILIDLLLEGSRPPGYAVQSRNHNAVAAAIAQRRADWGVAIQGAAQAEGLGFLPIRAEQYDFVTPHGRASRPAVACFLELLETNEIRSALEKMGFSLVVRRR